MNPTDVGITAFILYWIIKELISLIKYMFNKKNDDGHNTCGFQPVQCQAEDAVEGICTAESRDVTKLRMDQNNEQHEKMIGLMTTMNTSLTLMNETVQSTNGKAARTEKTVDYIRQQIN